MKPVGTSHIPKHADEAVKSIGQAIRTARISRNLTQTQLAEKTMVSRDCIRRMESGDPGVSIGNIVTALWSLGLDAQFSSSIAPAQDGFGELMRLQAAPRRSRPESADELETKLDF